MTLNQVLADAGLPTHAPLGGGSLAAKPLYPSRAFRQRTTFCELPPRQRTRVLALFLDLSGDVELRRWVRHDRCACRWASVRTALWGYLTGEWQPAAPPCPRRRQHTNPYAPHERRGVRP